MDQNHPRAAGLHGAMCSHHSDAPAVEICPQCGDFICSSCTGHQSSGDVVCVRCREQGNPLHGAEAFPWERRGELGFFGGLLDSWKGVVVEPHRVFRGLASHDAPYGEALKYLMVVSLFGLVGQISSELGQLAALGEEYGAEYNELLGSSDVGLAGTAMFLAVVATLVILWPVGLLIGSFINAGIVHIACVIVGANQGGYKGTYRALAYSQVGAIVTGIATFLGGFAGFLGVLVYGIVSVLVGLVSVVAASWSLVCLVFALRDVHQVSTGRAAGAVGIWLGSIFLFVCIIVAIATALGVAVASSL